MNPSLAPRTIGEVTFKEKILAFSGVWETLLVFFIVMGGIYLGFMNPTEAGAIGATCLFVIMIAKRKLTLKGLSTSLSEAVRVSVLVLFLVAGANVFSYFLALSTIPMVVSDWMAGLAVSRYAVLAIIVVIYLILGCFLDAISMMVLTMPVIYPVIRTLNFDPIFFGGALCPHDGGGTDHAPCGAKCLYPGRGGQRTFPMEEIFRGTLPFLLSILAVVILITIFPEIALVLPQMMGH